MHFVHVSMVWGTGAVNCSAKAVALLRVKDLEEKVMDFIGRGFIFVQKFKPKKSVEEGTRHSGQNHVSWW